MKYFTKAMLGALVISATSTAAFAEGKTVRIASHVGELAPLIAQANMFTAKVNERLPGAFDFQIFPGGQLGKESALIENLQLDSLEMAIVASGVLKLDSKLGVFDIPFLFDDRAHVQRAMKAGLQNQIVKRAEEKSGLAVVGVYENGFRHVINSKGPITTPNDMSGMKIRVSGGKFRQDVFASMGAVPTKVSWGETFAAMQTGVVDGAEAAAYGFYGKKMYEVQKNLSLTSHVYTPSFLLASQGFMKSLSEEQRKVFKEVGAEITEAAYAEAAELEAKYLKDMEARLKVNKTDGAAFQKATEGVSKSYIDKNGDDFLKIIEETRNAS